jgi:mono/diheme cytochrome c family protein
MVIGGWKKEVGMPSFADVLKPNDAEAIRSYLAREADLLYEVQQTAAGSSKK